jgi:hypothetical protein
MVSPLTESSGFLARLPTAVTLKLFITLLLDRYWVRGNIEASLA